MESPNPNQNPESIIEMASAKNNPDKKGKSEKLQKSKEQARESFEKRFNVLVSSIQSQIKEYKAKLEDGSFEDKEGEGMGEKRKEEMERSITKGVDRIESMKSTLDSGEDIPNITTQIEVDYVYTNPDTKKVERQETITLDLEKKLEEFTDFYKEMNIDIPLDFENEVRDIWQRNYDEIQKAVEKQGFDDILIIPANIPLTEISQKMKMDKGYYDYIKSNSNVQDLNGIPLTSIDTDKTRIILIHKAQNIENSPELKSTQGKKAEELTIDESLSLDDYTIFQRIYFKETGKHLDEKGWTWLLRTKSGSRFVLSDWDPAVGWLYVYAYDPDISNPNLGCRASRYFT